MYDPGRQSSGGSKMHPGAQLSRRERAAMERMLALEHGGAPPIAMPPPELLPRRPPSFVDPTPREPPAVVPTVTRRDPASNPGHALRSAAMAFSSEATRPLTAPYVPTGMKQGVSIGP